MNTSKNLILVLIVLLAGGGATDAQPLRLLNHQGHAVAKDTNELQGVWLNSHFYGDSFISFSNAMYHASPGDTVRLGIGLYSGKIAPNRGVTDAGGNLAAPINIIGRGSAAWDTNANRFFIGTGTILTNSPFSITAGVTNSIISGISVEVDGGGASAIFMGVYLHENMNLTFLDIALGQNTRAVYLGHLCEISGGRVTVDGLRCYNASGWRLISRE